jgi:hypothetical protein
MGRTCRPSGYPEAGGTGWESVRMTRSITQETGTRRIRTMIHLTSSKDFRRWSKDLGHAVAVLILTVLLPIFLGEFTFLKGTDAIYKGLFRFLRLFFALFRSSLASIPLLPFSPSSTPILSRSGLKPFWIDF